ncbi:MAG: hypothetical protein U9R21_07395, partial [Candidatus Thermoplasmatota archaeon]|nr:hypothetical protein [Candidatus Thermoplasmatota archaeon]
MSSLLTDEMDIHYERYKMYFEDNEKTYLQIVKEIMDNRNGNRQFKTVFKLARGAFLNEKTPLYDDLFNGSLYSSISSGHYSEKSIGIQRSMLKKLGILDSEGCFTEQFFEEYLKRYDAHIATKKKYVCVKHDVVLNPDISIDMSFTYENTIDTIRKNPTDVTYHFPEHLKNSAKTLNYDDIEGIQIVKLHHVGGNPRIPIPLMYHYKCACGNEKDLPYETKHLVCDNEECKLTMVRSQVNDTFKSGYASQVTEGDLNNIPIVSLIELPLGAFNAAVFMRRNKSGYYLFMIAVEDITIESPDLSVSDNEHAIWQLIRRIDQNHESVLKKHLEGLEWYKAAIILAYLANYQHHTSLNILAFGDGGTGKTGTARFYMATLTRQQKLQDVTSLSEPGLYGSTTTIALNDTTVQIPEAGFLSRYKLVTIDEVYQKHSLLASLRGLLRNTNITKEVHNNRITMPKNATVIGTSNPIPAVKMKQADIMNNWIKENEEGIHTALSEEYAHAAMVKEYISQNLDWHTGDEIPNMDRWAFAFFIKNPSDKLELHHLDPADMKIDDHLLSQLLYDQQVDDYLSFCSQIAVDWESQKDRILEFAQELRKHDKVHTTRIGQDINMILQLSAQINGRAHLTDEDFDFVRELWSKTCEWVDVAE